MVVGAPTTHDIPIKWDTDASGTRTNPRLPITEFSLAGITLRYRVGRNPTCFEKAPYALGMSITDSRVSQFDAHWRILLMKRYQKHGNGKMIKGDIVYCLANGFTNLFPIHGFQLTANDARFIWTIIDYDVHPHRETFLKPIPLATSVYLAKEAKNVFVNKELLRLDSDYFKQVFDLPENKDRLTIEDIGLDEFLDYVYATHPPTVTLTVPRLASTCKMAKLFENRAVEKACIDSATKIKPKTAEDRCELLRWANANKQIEIFKRTLGLITVSDFKTIDKFDFEGDYLALMLKKLLGYTRIFPQWSFGNSSLNSRPSLSTTHHFLINKKLAEERGFDCTLVVEGNEEKPIYVKKAILAANSKYFETLFYGKFSESSQDTVTLKDVSFDEFLEYLQENYPPQRKLDMCRIGALLKLADCYQNETLLKHCEDFLALNKTKEQRLRVLYCANDYRLEKLFSEVLADCQKTDFAKLDRKRIVQTFGKKNVELLVKAFLLVLT